MNFFVIEAEIRQDKTRRDEISRAVCYVNIDVMIWDRGEGEGSGKGGREDGLFRTGQELYMIDCWMVFDIWVCWSVWEGRWGLEPWGGLLGVDGWRALSTVGGRERGRGRYRVLQYKIK